MYSSFVKLLSVSKSEIEPSEREKSIIVKCGEIDHC